MECGCVYKPEALPSQPFIIWRICCHGVYGGRGNIDKKGEPASLDCDALVISVHGVMMCHKQINKKIMSQLLMYSL